ncbi:Sterile alpha motif, type 1, partial [Globisporangium splendens]
MDTCSSGSAPNGSSWSGVSASAMRVNPCEAVANAGTWGYTLVGQCFSRLRRVQFNEEHQRSLLSRHSTEDDYSFPDEAMLELRRRVLKVESDSHRLPTCAHGRVAFGLLVVCPYEPKRSQSFASQWEKRKAKALALKQQQRAAVQPMPEQNSNSNNSPHIHTTAPKEFKTLLSDTEKALDSILGKSDEGVLKPISPHVRAADVRRLSVDELLSLRPSSAASTCSSSTSSGSFSPEKTGAECNNQVDDPADEPDTPKLLSPDAQMLRAWFANIDPQHPSDYHAYARDFESQGFHALEDLAELDEDDVEQTMSEIGIAKFAHRACIRKAILRLRSDTFQNENSSSLMNSN